MNDMDPFALAARQVEIDREATKHLPALLERKKQRVAPSPHAFLRGSAPLFYEILAERRDLAAGPAGDGWIVGDMHLENVGAYRDDADEVVFGLNDFDDATLGPLRYDVLRLSVSVLLASRGFQATGRQAIGLVERAVGAYLKARGGAAAPPMPAPVLALVERARSRSNKALLDDRAPGQHGKRCFLRGERYHDLPPDIEARVPALLAAYVAALGDRAPGKAAEWKVEDAALRVAGNGSLGVIRLAVLVRDRAGDERLVELKECREPSTEALFQPPPGHWTHPAERCAGAARALCAAPPRRLAPVLVDGLSFVGRRLFPQEDKLDLGPMRAGAQLDALVAFIGHLLGAAHARGMAALGGPPPPTWTGAEVDAVIDHAVVLAGLFEGVYLAWVRRNAFHDGAASGPKPRPPSEA
jgi:uncharacterized protein (DUF2252 family)